MTVKWYEFGNAVGGASSSGLVIPLDAAYGPPQTFTGVLGAGITTITFDHPTKSVTIRDTHDSDPLQYSFDGGITWLDLGSFGEKTETVSVSSMLLQAVAAGTPTYEIVAALTE